MKAAILVTACVLAACAGNSDQQTQEEAQAAPAENGDAQIFERTMARARAERLDTLPIGEVVARVGTWFVGAPYTPATLEAPGAESLVVNLREFDCVTYVESMLAMARLIRAGQGTFDDFKRTLQTIRYRDGKLTDYPSRLHYFSEWIRNNQSKGIVEDRTQALGGVIDAEPINFMSEHRNSYRQLADADFFQQVRTHELGLSQQPRYMIPEARIDNVAQNIRNGDVIAATSSVEGLDVAHTGLALWQNGKLHMMHAPLIGDSVEISENSLAERIVFIERQDGIMVARPREPR